jgi:regulator of cell morphogenesis and NO signaling
MFLPSVAITSQSFVKDIVSNDHRTVDVFRKYGIEYCCGAKWPLETVCLMHDIEPVQLIQELHHATRPLQLPGFTAFHEWPIDFLTDYIIHVHHHFLKQFIPACWPLLNRFVDEHLKKDPRLYEVQSCYRKMQKEILPHLEEEENIVFPYIRQLGHAYENNDQYARLLVKTLRKPVDTLMNKEHEIVLDMLSSLRRLTDSYTPPEKACTSHRVVFGKLRELDNDLVQHMYLENKILFPRAMAMEKELLNNSGSGVE